MSECILNTEVHDVIWLKQYESKEGMGFPGCQCTWYLLTDYLTGLHSLDNYFLLLFPKETSDLRCLLTKKSMWYFMLIINLASRPHLSFAAREWEETYHEKQQKLQNRKICCWWTWNQCIRQTEFSAFLFFNKTELFTSCYESRSPL